MNLCFFFITEKLGQILKSGQKLEKLSDWFSCFKRFPSTCVVQNVCERVSKADKKCIHWVSRHQ